MKTAPKVSVVTICYNQEKYIGEALQSFVEQQTDFPFEIIVADDKSTDKTPEIIEAYAKKYPDLFVPVLRKKNYGVQKNMRDALKRARGAYIALCEGDDYWTDNTKLQRQADFLDSHPAYGMCFHPVRVFFQNKEEEDSFFPAPEKGHVFTVNELLRWNFIQTNSVMYRKQNYDKMPEEALPLDWYMHLYHAQFGKIGYIDRVMGAYRRHASGIWWAAHNNRDELWRKHALEYLHTYKAILSMYGGDKKHVAILRNGTAEIFENIIDVENKYHEGLLHKATTMFPEDAEALMVSRQQKIREMESRIAELEKNLQAKHDESVELRKEIQDKADIVAAQAKELTAIKTSRVWVARNKVARVVGKKVI